MNGISRNGQLQVQTQAGDWSGEGCIKTFAYWNPEWLTGERLLNSQTGELQPVSIRVVGEETIPVLGLPTRTTHRRIVTDKFAVDLWYTLNGEMGCAAIHHEEWRYPSLYAPVREQCLL